MVFKVSGCSAMWFKIPICIIVPKSFLNLLADVPITIFLVRYPIASPTAETKIDLIREGEVVISFRVLLRRLTGSKLS